MSENTLVSNFKQKNESTSDYLDRMTLVFGSISKWLEWKQMNDPNHFEIITKYNNRGIFLEEKIIRGIKIKE